MAPRTRSSVVADDDAAVLPGGAPPKPRSIASYAGWTFAATLYVVALYVIVSHPDEVRYHFDVQLERVYDAPRRVRSILLHTGLHTGFREFGDEGVRHMQNHALVLYLAQNESHAEFVRDLETMPASMRHGVELRKHDCGHPTAFRICSQYGYNAEIIALHPVLMFWRNSEWSGNFHDSYYEENADVKHTHTEQGRSAHVRAVSAWLRNASKHHHQIVWDRKMLSERVSASRMQAMRSMMAAQVEKEQAETKAAEDEIPDEGAKVEL